MKDVCLYTLKSLVSFCMRVDIRTASTMIKKLEAGAPIDWCVEEYDLGSRGIEALNAYQILRDLMDAAMQSVECSFLIEIVRQTTY